ncbi:MAG: prepilin peptidase [Verrucomicrobia bacterium]|nr:prepilin peptidase [Verrucomicrobiota bacterium]
MPPETRSLWEQLDSEVEPWRRGRSVLVVFAICSLFFQGWIVVDHLLAGNIEGVISFGSICVLFWLSFYFIWIGVHWVRWLIGAFAGFVGFWSLIWGWRDGDAFLLVFAVINFLIATYSCLASSVYFFAKRQQETRSWIHALVVAAVFILLLGTFVIGTGGLFVYHVREHVDANEFVTEAADRIYTDQDRDWMIEHLARADVAATTRENLNAFFAQNVGRLGPVLQISAPAGLVRIIYHFPTQFISRAQVTADGKSAYGPVRLYFWVSDYGNGWQIDRTWWERTYTETPPSYK